MQKKEPIKKRNFSKKCPNKNFLQQNKSLKSSIKAFLEK